MKNVSSPNVYSFFLRLFVLRKVSWLGVNAEFFWQHMLYIFGSGVFFKRYLSVTLLECLLAHGLLFESI